MMGASTNSKPKSFPFQIDVLVEVESFRAGGLLFRVVSDRHWKRFAADMRRNGCAAPDRDVLFQFVEDPDDLHVPPRYWADLEGGWSVRYRLDAWEARHFYGWCSD